MERKTKTIIVITLCIAIVGLSVGYAALNSILNIAGNAKVGATAANWNISFKNVNCEAGGYAEAGSISSTGTTITISESKLKAPKDYVICTFDVVNDGTIDAEVTSVTVPDPSSFTYEGTTTTDEELVKNGLVSEMKYNNTNKDEIKIGDKLNKGASKAVYIKIEYSESVTKLPTNEVAISDIFGQIVFGQSGSSGSEEGGGSESLVYLVGDAVYYNPVSGTSCDDYTSSQSTGTAKTGCLKWYVINDGGETIDVLLDHNTTYSVAWNSSGSNASGPSELLTQLQSDTSSWSDSLIRSDSYTDPLKGYTIDYTGYKARLIEANEIAKITGAATVLQWDSGKPYGTTIGTQSSWYHLDGAYGTDSVWQTRVATSTGASHYAWLFDYTNSCTSYGCNTANSGTYGYRTSSASARDSNYAWIVGSSGSVVNNYVNYSSNYGLRPVITISKSNLSQ